MIISGDVTPLPVPIRSDGPHRLPTGEGAAGRGGMLFFDLLKWKIRWKRMNGEPTRARSRIRANGIL